LGNNEANAGDTWIIYPGIIPVTTMTMAAEITAPGRKE
jgi:hypothetical protein